METSDLSDRQWERFRPLLPPQKPRTGRPAKDHRTVLRRPRIRPDRVAGDKGSSSPTVRRYLKRRGIGAVIPTKADEAPNPAFDREVYRERNVIERLINRLKQHWRIATRFEKHAANYQAMLTLVAIPLWL